MKNKKRLALFILLAAVQLFVVLYMAWQWENILLTGQRFEWETAPVDPYDAFKGRYIDLGFKETSGPALAGSRFAYGQKVYAIIGKNAGGQAIITGVSPVRPLAEPYVNVRVASIDKDKVRVELPFRRYYLPENLATPAETAYRQNRQAGVAVIRLKDGYGVVEELYIGSKTLTDFLREDAAR